MTTSSHPLTRESAPLPGRPACSTNQQTGPELDTQTVKALLGVPLTAVSAAEPYRFCPAPDCPTVYYRADGQQVFGEADLRERVYQKHADDPTSVICYCFGFTVGAIRAEVARAGRSAIRGQIVAGIHNEQCACDIRNPQGSCCLGNVDRLIDAALRALQFSPPPRPE